MENREIYRILNEAYFSEDPHEKKVLEHLSPILRRVKVFVDIGASLGQYTLFASKHMRGGHVLAIEADPIRFEELERNCRKWESLTDNKLTALHAAVCDKDGQTSFFVTNSDVSGGLFEHDIRHKAVDWHEIVVDCFRLDTFFLQRCSPDLVKIDVEGGELRVLRGAARILGGEAKFLIEVHRWVDPEGQRSRVEVFDFMKSFGYYPIDLYGGRYLFVKPGLFWYKAKLRDLVRRLRNLVRARVAKIFGEKRGKSP